MRLYKFFQKNNISPKNLARTINFFDVHTPKATSQYTKNCHFKDSLNMIKNKPSDFVSSAYKNPQKAMYPINLSYNFRKFLDKK